MAQTASLAAKPVTGLARHAVAPAAVGTAVLLVLTAAATLGGKLPATRILPAPPSLALNVGRDPSGLTFPSVTNLFLAQTLGSDAGAFLPTGPRTAPGPAPSVSASPRPDAESPRPSPSPSPTASPTRLPSPFQFSELHISMRADRSEVAPGGTITYRAIVTNVGNEEFRGAYQLSSHIPFGTVDATSPCGGALGIDPAHGCVNPPFPTPGSPDPSVHQISSGFSGRIGRGKQRITVFKVRVNETTQAGTRLENHVHLDTIGDGKPTRTSNTVVVVVTRSSPLISPV